MRDLIGVLGVIRIAGKRSTFHWFPILRPVCVTPPIQVVVTFLDMFSQHIRILFVLFVLFARKQPR